MKIVPTSAEPLRKQWLTRYHEIEKKLSRLKRDWNVFEREAQDSYQQWYHATFGQTLSDLTAIGDELHELRTILAAVEAQMEVNRLTRRAALEHVITAVEEKRDPFPDQRETDRHREERKKAFEKEFQAEHSPFGDEAIDSELLERARTSVYEMLRRQKIKQPNDPLELMRLNQAIDEAIHDLYEKLKREKQGKEDGGCDDFYSGDESEGGGNEDENHGRDENHIASPPQNDDYKVLYRKIVKRLHPDRGEEMSPDEKAIWAETQRAYQARNEEALKTILLRVEGGGVIHIHLLESIGEIIEITRSLCYEYEEIKFYQRRTKKAPVYRFWASQKRPKNRDKLRLEIQGQLLQQLFYSRRELKVLRSDLNYLKKTTRKK